MIQKRGERRPCSKKRGTKGADMNTTSGFGERLKLPQRGPGSALAENKFWCISNLKLKQHI